MGLIRISIPDDPRWLAAAISIVLSVWVIATNDTLNVDGILYLDVAHQLQQGNWKEAVDLYRWIFYPSLIAIVGKISFLDLETTAHIINTVIFAAFTWLYLTVLITLRATRPVLIAGMIIVLIHPYINEYRSDILRGPGYWLFLMWSLIFFIRYYETARLADAITWGITISTAILFRIDGITYLAFLPLILLVRPDMAIKIRFKRYAICMIVPTLLGLLAVSGILLDLLPVGRLSEPLKLASRLFMAVTETIPAMGKEMSTHVLHHHAKNFGVLGVYITLFAILLSVVIKRSTLLLLAAGCYAIVSRRVRDTIPSSPVLVWFAAINLATLLVFVLGKHFLSSRFAMPFALIMSIFAAYAIAELFARTNSNSVKTRVTKGVVVFLMFLMTIDGLWSFGHSKIYLRESGQWIRSQMSPGDQLLGNHLVIHHYAGQRLTKDKKEYQKKFSSELRDGHIDLDKISSADIIAISEKYAPRQQLADIQNHLGKQPDRIFSASSGDRILVFINKPVIK